MSYEANNKKLFTGGYRIYTSIDMNVQNKLQEVIDNKMAINTETNEMEYIHCKVLVYV